jgi:radical SAM superfamily enzyme YgiQ (UPF0313 family)
MYREILQDDKQSTNLIDFICIGEAENSFLELAKILIFQILGRNDVEIFETRLTSVHGIAYNNSRGELILQNQVSETDLEKLPLPARYKLDHEYYYYTIANVIVNRGCPNQCSFCSRQKLFKKTKIRSIESITSEIRDIISMQTYSYINFYDNININNNFFRDFCQMFIDHGIKIPWGCEVRVDTIEDEDAWLIKQAGCKLIATGIESASLQVLKKNFKYQDPSKVIDGIRNLKRYEIPIQAYFVLGLPGETIETFQETIGYINELPLDERDKINYFVATPYPGSRLWDDKDIFKIKIIEKNFFNYDCEHLIFETEKMSISELEKLYIIAKKIENSFKGLNNFL